MVDQNAAVGAVSYLNSIGTAGLAFIVWALMTGRLITKRELDACLEREKMWQGLYMRATATSDQAMDRAFSAIEIRK